MGRHGVTLRGMSCLMLGPALSAALLATGCGRTDGAGPGTGTPASPLPASASPSSDAELCARIVARWSRKVLAGGTYGDYQSMGLSDGQYEILRAVVAAARVAERHQGPSAADKLIIRQARTACTERYRHGTPSGGPWQ